MNKIFQSSSNPAKLSLTIRGILIGLIPLALLLSGVAGANLVQADFENLIETLIGAITAITMAVSAIATLYGVIRKIVLSFKK